MRELIVKTYRLEKVETEVLKCLADRLTNKEIASNLRWDQEGVRNRLQNLYRKTKAVDREALIYLGKWYVEGTRPSDEDEPPDIWRCTAEPDGCGMTKRMGEFPFWPIDMRCTECIAEQVESNKMDLKRRRARRAVSDALKSMKAQWVRLPHINNMLSELIDKDGGYSKFVEEWFKQLDAARKDRPGSKYVLDHHRDIARLLAQANEADLGRMDVDAMDDDETREYLANILLSHLAKKGTEDMLGIFNPPEDEKESA